MTKTERTNRLLAQFHGLKDEFEMLKGVLCMSHGICPTGITNEEYFAARKVQKRVEAMFDRAMIAKRMDQINVA